MKTSEYLDQLRKKFELTSDYQVAKKLGCSRTRVSNYRTGAHFFDDAMCIKIASLLELPEALILADIQAERSKADDVKHAWEKIADHFRKSAAAVVLLGFIGGLVAAPHPAEAVQTTSNSPSSLSIM